MYFAFGRSLAISAGAELAACTSLGYQFNPTAGLLGLSNGLPMTAGASLAACIPPGPDQFMCSPVILERLGPHILRSHISTAQFKPIPNNAPVDLDCHRFKQPEEWGMDDVIAWLISIARRHQIPVQELNIHRFANCTGPLLMLMNQQNFVDRDGIYGYLLYMEFRKLVGDENSFLDDWMRVYRDESGASSSTAPTPAMSLCAPQPGPSQSQTPQELTVIRTVSSPGPSQTPSSVKSIKARKRPTPSLGTADEPGVSNPDVKLKKGPLAGKVSKPRRRTQHTKGNKLWEFIRDALKDPATCPSVVRWEDANEGVFRIVESEKLARLWGDKKNNEKMTYEKLSRAMRTYYEKNILVPVPKTGLYPKKLVYKFGPESHGWQRPDPAEAAVKLETCDTELNSHDHTV